MCVCVRARYEEHTNGKGMKALLRIKTFLSNFSLIRESDILVAYLRKQQLTG